MIVATGREDRGAGEWRVVRRASRRALLGCLTLASAVVVAAGATWATDTASSPAARVDLAPTPTPRPEPSPQFGRVIYRASKVGSFEALGIATIACRHRDPQVRSFTVEFFDRRGRRVQTFGQTSAGVRPGDKVVFISDDGPFPDTPYLDMKVGHLSVGTARVVSDARVVKCRGRMRFDGGHGHPSRWTGMGMHRAGVGATPVPDPW